MKTSARFAGGAHEFGRVYFDEAFLMPVFAHGPFCGGLNFGHEVVFWRPEVEVAPVEAVLDAGFVFR